jgi:hypothetical protein
MSTLTQPRGATNDRVELARYRISSGERLICGQRVDGLVRLVDIPVSQHGRRYLIERGLTSMRELEAIVTDYVQQAARWDAIPAETVCLDHLVAQAS